MLFAADGTLGKRRCGMRGYKALSAAGLTALVLAGCAKTTADATRTAEVACGGCMFAMEEGNGCDLAIRIDGRAYPVEGASIDDFGDAHAADGMCNMIRTADVVGRVEGDRFVAESIVLRP